MERQYRQVCAQIAEAARRSGRKPEEIRLVAVTKERPWEQIAPLYTLGQRDFGESRVQQTLDKKSLAPHDCHWHLIGSLQSNKVQQAIGQFVLIHSVDSLSLATKISQHSAAQGLVTSILLQVNTSGESTKHGFSIEECRRDIDTLLLLPHIALKGFMTIAPLTHDQEHIRRCFAALRHLRDELQLLGGKAAEMKELSMGMSHDFPLAIAEGATLVRIGTALFG